MDCDNYPMPIRLDYATVIAAGSTIPSLTRGDRVHIKEGYDGAGDVFYYGAKSSAESGMVLLYRDQACGDEAGICLADAIETYPYTREERIERAIEDFYDAMYGEDFTKLERSVDWEYHAQERAFLFALLDAGV